MELKTLVLIVCIFGLAVSARRDVPKDIVKVIQEHAGDVRRIISYMRNGSGKGQPYDRLADLTDTFGQRLSGSKALEDAIDSVLKALEEEGLENVHGETVKVPDWRRGKESLVMLTPRYQPMAVLGLGDSPNTSAEGLVAEVVVVRTFEELEALSDDKVMGKIVVYNQEYEGYSATNKYRYNGASEASKKGAVAALVRSLTGYSQYTTHTGQHTRPVDSDAIPTASITIEDANFLQRLYDKGEPVTLHLKMEAQRFPDVESRNIVAEIKGSEFPDEVVMFGGHVDSWDVGNGALDDGGGIIISWQVLSILKALGLRPKRTMRMVMWTAEEPGVYGANQYYERHKGEAEKMSFALESDDGVFMPYGIAFSGCGAAFAIMEEVMSLLAPINATQVVPNGGGADVGMWDGVPKGSLYSANENYFHYHHTEADRMDVLDTTELDLASVVWTVATYVVADLPDLLPRTGEYKVKDELVHPIVKNMNMDEFAIEEVPNTKQDDQANSSSVGAYVGAVIGLMSVLIIIFAIVKTVARERHQYSYV